MRRHVVALIVFVTTIAMSEEIAHAVQGGTDDTTHSYVVGVTDTALETVCTGTLITPNLVMTSRRCVQAAPALIDCAQNPKFTGSTKSMRIATEADLASADWKTVKQVVVDANDAVCGNDIALLVLSDLVQTATPIAPAVNHPPNHASFSRKHTAIGYGQTGPSASDEGKRRRLEQIMIECVPGDATFPCPSGFDASEFAGGDGMCPTDLGLAALEQTSFTNGAPVALGILSRTAASCADAVFTRVDIHRDLIVAAAESASDNWTLYGKPSWADPPPPPDAGPEEPDAGDGGASPTTTPTPGGGKTTTDAGASEDDAAAAPDGGGCRSAPKSTHSRWLAGTVLLVGAVVAHRRRRRRNAS